VLYELLVPLAKYHTAFNVFRYITFRTAMATVTALVISFILGPWLISRLRQMQHGETSVREDTPERHRAKAGTPTMGGIGILVAILASTLLWADLRNRYIWVLMLATAGLGLIGLKDDWTKLKTRKGISAKEKFGTQIVLVGALMAFLYFWPAEGFTTSVVIPFFKGWLITFGTFPWLWIPFAMLVIVGASNAVNLTDGLDGLAIGPIVTAGGAFAVIAYLTGNFRAAEYLRILNVKGTGELTIFCGALVGAALGFLWFNSYPAQVFMGDVGSLALGGAIGTLAVLTKSELLLPLIGGIYVVEAASVIIQVGSFKLTGRRVFRMAPLHHHYEIKGWAEPKIIVRFWILSFMLALLALTTLKLR
jgi:phospho-N-acetylmuramoyl-pentapeptide-transferase